MKELHCYNSNRIFWYYENMKCIHLQSITLVILYPSKSNSTFMSYVAFESVQQLTG